MQSNIAISPQMTPPSERTQTTDESNSSGENVAVYVSWGLFAILLAVVTCKHKIYLDEAQAWLIARDSRNLIELFQHLHYEGHPALWYLLIFLPAHLSSHMAWIQAINYVLAVAMAWLVLSERRLPMGIRVLTVFSVFLFFYMGAVARSYMLAGILLVAAARCLQAERPRHWLAITLLALAMNAHFLAIPVAAAIFVWLYWLSPVPAWNSAAEKLKERRFWLSAAILATALAACYFTLRPAPDLDTPQYQVPGATAFGNLAIAIGSVWTYFVPFPLDGFSASNLELLAPQTHPSLIAALLTMGLWLLALSVLSARRSRWFMVSVSLLWTAAIAATVHHATPFHASFLFVGFVIALMADTPDGRDRSWLPAQYSSLVLLILLSMQASIGLHAFVEECLFPFSGAEPTAKWLQSAGLSQRPLAIESDLSAPSVLGYLGIQSAYFPTCRCRGSFVVFQKGRDLHRQVTAEELQTLHREFGAAPVVISAWKIPEDSRQKLNLQLRYTSPHGWFWGDEDLFVYDSDKDAANAPPGP